MGKQEVLWPYKRTQNFRGFWGGFKFLRDARKGRLYDLAETSKGIGFMLFRDVKNKRLYGFFGPSKKDSFMILEGRQNWRLYTIIGTSKLAALYFSITHYEWDFFF